DGGRQGTHARRVYVRKASLSMRRQQQRGFIQRPRAEYFRTQAVYSGAHSVRLTIHSHYPPAVRDLKNGKQTMFEVTGCVEFNIGGDSLEPDVVQRLHVFNR